MSFISLLAQASSSLGGYSDPNLTTNTTSPDVSAGMLAALFGVLLIPFLISIAITVVLVIAQWKIFVKAGKPGWASIVPIYNVIILLEIVGRPVWWLALMLVPVANFVVAIIVAIDLVKSFGKDIGFAVLLILLPFIGYPMLGFGNAEYAGPSVSGSDPFGVAPVNSGQPSGTATTFAQPTVADQALSGDGQNPQAPTPPPPPVV